MKKIILTFLLFISITLFAGDPDPEPNDIKTINIHGKVVDNKTGEKLTGVLIQIRNMKVYTDLNGEFSINLVPGKYDIIVSYISYETNILYIEDYENDINIKIESK